MTATATPVSQALKEWTKIFPKQITENYTSSVTFMKQLTVVAISTITYLKNAFSEDSYTVEHFGGLKLRILKKKCRNDLAQFLSTALTQAFDAFDKKYLHQLALCFYEGECKVNNLVEYHIFEYSYNKDGVSMSVHSKSRDSAKQTIKYTFENVRERTIHLIRACVVMMQTCQPDLPDGYDVSLRLYYNEDAPEDYQAPGYHSDGQDHLEASSTLGDIIQLGCVETPFHSLAASSFIKDNIRASHEAIPSPNPPIMTQISQEDFANITQSKATVINKNSDSVRCSCNNYEGQDVRDTPLITCYYCNTQQHAVCFGVLAEDVARLQQHCCCECADADHTRSPTDPGMSSLPSKKRECMCIFRRALAWCGSTAGGASSARLAGQLALPHTHAVKLLKLLASYGIVGHHDTDTTTPRKINQEQLKSTMSKFFQKCKVNIVDRLLAETLASQESQPDPVGDVLGPLEKVSLQNASKHGKVVDNPDVQPKVVEDSTLLQYKEALISNNDKDEELPLSGSHNPIKDMDSLGKKSFKRKLNENEDRPTLRTGVRTKKSKTRE
ncbi:uncharacterized protein ACR2FA_004758 [Aphomia sociella]